MDEVYVTNRAELCGRALALPEYSHESRGIRFFTFPLETRRLSGTADTLNIVVRQSMLPEDAPFPAGQIRITGELRSFNNKSGSGNRLVLTILAREIRPESDSYDENHISLLGTVCKAPTLRVTPMGREICDVILAVGRRYHRSDYIPVIAWGQQARQTALVPVGTQLSVQGRLQSRPYTKVIDGQIYQRVAYEVSAADIFPL
ncbi:MAG: single-stranded DNA-binding protein [Oscillospiraceae bacterium]|nr:single-stranded DNA-binding protein [Oscillospiraceae bacterium]